MHYWIDGYNFFFRLSKNYRAMKNQERHLLESLYQAMMQLRSPMTVVFDGREKDPAEALRRHLLSMTIIYTPAHQTADNYILDMIEYSLNPADEMVVSSDNELIRRAKQKGARTQTIEAFIQDVMRKKNPAPKNSPEKKQLRESSSQFERLLNIFEQRLKNDEGPL